jgi:hypothetical protein
VFIRRGGTFRAWLRDGFADSSDDAVALDVRCVAAARLPLAAFGAIDALAPRER